MTYNPDWRPRLSIDLGEERFKKLQELMPWGVRNQLFRIIVDELIKMLEDHGPMVVGAILSEKVKLTDILKGDKNV